MTLALIHVIERAGLLVSPVSSRAEHIADTAMPVTDGDWSLPFMMSHAWVNHRLNPVQCLPLHDAS